MIHHEHVVRLRLNGPGDALAVLRPEHERSQDQQVERALQMSAVFPIRSFPDRHELELKEDRSQVSAPG